MANRRLTLSAMYTISIMSIMLVTLATGAKPDSGHLRTAVSVQNVDDLDIPENITSVMREFPIGQTRFRFVKCESIHYRRNVCTSNGTIVRFVFFRQRSRTRCVRNVNFWVGRDGVTVDKGCRAYFFYLTIINSESRDVACQSRNFGVTNCAVGKLITRVRLIRRTSAVPCFEGLSYRAFGDSMQVNYGCGGVFRAYY